MRYLYIFSAFLFFASCKFNDSKTISNIYSDTLQNLVLPLDDESIFNNVDIQYIDSLGKLLVLNEINNRIYEYNINTKRIVNTNSYSIEGPQGVGQLAAFHLHAPDSLFLINGLRQIIMVDSMKNIRFRIQTMDFDYVHDAPDIYITRSGRHMSVHNNKLFMAGVGRMINPVAPYLKLANLKFSTTYSYPPIEAYKNQTTLNGYLIMHYRDYNSYSKQFVLSFPIDDSLRITDFESYNFSHLAKASNIGEIDPLVNDVSHMDFTYQHLLMSYYREVYYDRYRKLYYRFYENGVTVEDIRASNSTDFRDVKPLGMIVLDKDFNKVGEYDLGAGIYQSENAFVTPKGLYILNRKKSLENEDQMVYTLFNFDNN